MTLVEAFYSGIMRVRIDPWNKYAHLEIKKINNGIAIIGTLRDIFREIDIPLIGMIYNTSWEKWIPPDDVERIAVDWPTYE